MSKKDEALKLALEALEVATTPLAKDRQEVLRAITAIREALAEQPEYRAVKTWHDGKPVYVVERSKDSAVPTLDVQSTMEMWKNAYERVCDERDAIVKDSDKAHALLRWAETEMRYAGWGARINDQHGRTDVYEAIVGFLK